MNRSIVRGILFVICLALMVGAVHVLIAGYDPARYVGRTRLMERSPTVHLSNLAAMARCPIVINRSCTTLSGLGVHVEPSYLSSHLTVRPVASTQILQIEVRATKPNDARAAADVVAAEFRRYCREATPKANGATDIVCIDPAYAYRANRPRLYRLLIAAGMFLLVGIIFAGAMLMGRE